MKQFKLIVVLLVGTLIGTSTADIEYDNDIEDYELSTDDVDVQPRVTEDPCLKLKCGAGRQCVIDPETDEGVCQCIQDCGLEIDPRRRVCTNHNETFPTDCEVYRVQCLCEEGDPSCEKPDEYKHMHIEYYGECKEIPTCTEGELVDFPRRMREWLFNVMSELSERKEISYFYQKMEKEAEKDMQIRWRNAAIWKWCDLDGHPSDNVVSRHELFPIKAPLQSLEHCIGNFLDGCDENTDHKISMKEWGKCLEIPEEEMIAECERVNEQQENL